MWIQEVVVLGVWVGAGATQGVLDARPSGDRERRGVADGGARVPEVLTVSELEGKRGGPRR